MRTLVYRSQFPRELIEYLHGLFEDGVAIRYAWQDVTSRGYAIDEDTIENYYNIWREDGQVTGIVTHGYIDEFLAITQMRLDAEDIDSHLKLADRWIKLVDSREKAKHYRNQNKANETIINAGKTIDDALETIT